MPNRLSSQERERRFALPMLPPNRMHSTESLLRELEACSFMISPFRRDRMPGRCRVCAGGLTFRRAHWTVQGVAGLFTLCYNLTDTRYLPWRRP
jgi:hypothetical protein